MLLIVPLLFTVVVPIGYPKISEGSLRRLEKAVIKEMPRGTGPAPDSFGGHLKALLDEELKEAWNAYYRFDWSSGEEALAGRSDPSALSLRALIAFAEGQDDLTRRLFLRLIRIAPETEFSKKDYPPRFLSLFAAVKKEGVTGGHDPPDLPALFGHLMDEDLLTKSFEPWRKRLSKIAARGGWEEILAVGIERVGWQFKVYGISTKRPAPVEMRIKDLTAIPQAAKILARRLAPVDNLIDSDADDAVNYK